MIRIQRKHPAPASLQRNGPPQTKLDCAAFDKAPNDYRSGSRRFEDKKHYSKTAVKNVLMTMHSAKCYYCETKLYSPAYLHVEHFRPKGAVRQNPRDSQEFPGYYWLAYSWENLLLACAECNTSHKGTLFPLEYPTQRARSHNDDLAKERPLFVNPSEENPRDHICFQDDAPIGKTNRGWRTIEGLGLDRSLVTEQRREYFDMVQRHIDMIKIKMPPTPEIEALQDEARTFIAKSMGPDARFSSMVMDLVARRGL